MSKLPWPDKTIASSDTWSEETPYWDWQTDKWYAEKFYKYQTKHYAAPNWIHYNHKSNTSVSNGYTHVEKKPWEDLPPGKDKDGKEIAPKDRWPNTWWFWVQFYHSITYHTDTKYVSDYEMARARAKAAGVNSVHWKDLKEFMDVDTD